MNWKRLFFNKWLLIGFLIRLFLMPTTAHSDIWALSFSQYFLAFKGVFNIYDFLANLPLSHPLVKNYGTNFFTYPPLAYFTLGFFGVLLRPFFSSDFTPWLMENFAQAYRNSGVFKQLFLLKFPYLFFDLGLAFLLAGLFEDHQRQKKAFLFWIFNPLTLYTTFMIGQFDILPLFLVILALWLAKRKRYNSAALALGIGGAFKMFPLFFLLPLVLVVSRNLREKIQFLVLGVSPYILTILPFLSSSTFRRVVLFSDQSEKMLFARLMLSGAEGIYLFIFFYFLICFFTGYLKFSKEYLWIPLLAVLLLFFSLTHYHPQWFLWITPFLIIDLVINQKKHLAYTILLFSCFLLILFFFEPSLHLGLLSPLFPQLALVTGSFGEVMARFYDPFQFKSLIRSLFAATACFLIYLNFRHDQVKKDK